MNRRIETLLAFERDYIAAREAREVAQAEEDRALNMLYKSDRALTEADRAEINRLFPDHDYLG